MANFQINLRDNELDKLLFEHRRNKHFADEFGYGDEFRERKRENMGKNEEFQNRKELNEENSISAGLELRF